MIKGNGFSCTRALFLGGSFLSQFQRLYLLTADANQSNYVRVCRRHFTFLRLVVSSSGENRQFSG